MMKRMIRHILLLFVGMSSLAAACTENGDLPVSPGTDPDPFEPVPGGETVMSIEAVDPERIARVIGPTPAGENLPNPNNTMYRFGFGSTDYGNMWDAGNGRLWCIFGDNFDDRGGSWRSNAIAVSADLSLEDGLYYYDVIRDADGRMMEPIVSRAKTGQYPDGSEYEVTCIPTGGFSAPVAGGHRQYVNYMSIRQWNTDGNDMWSVNYSELVWSDDDGKSWTRSGVKWPSYSNFVQVAYVKRGDTLYMYGTPAGRKGNVYLAKVALGDVLDRAAYVYWNGGGWSSSEAEAVAVANGTVSEMSVRYNSYYKRYIMMYLSVNQRKVVYRDALSPEGEWSAEKILLTDGYAPYIHPWFCDGRDLWFVLSSVDRKPSASYDTWHIHLYRAKLREDAEGFNMIWEAGFENEPNESIAYRTLWNCPLSTSTRDCHGGKIACKTVNNADGEWKDSCTQTVKVHKNTDYVLTAWAKASVAGHRGAYLGVRLADGRICDDNPALGPDEWTQIRVEFNSGDNTTLDVFFGTWGAQGLYVVADDFAMTPKTME